MFGSAGKSKDICIVGGKSADPKGKTALAIGAFATTLTTLSCALMGFRGLSITTAFIGDFLAVAGKLLTIPTPALLPISTFGDLLASQESAWSLSPNGN